MVYSWNRTVFINKMWLSIHTCYITSEPWKHAKWKKPVTKDHIVWFCVYEVAIVWKYIKTEIYWVVATCVGGVGGNEDW